MKCKLAYGIYLIYELRCK